MKWDGGIRNTISALLLWQAGIEDPFPCRALREVVEYIPEAADPDSPVSQYGELICGCVREGGGGGGTRARRVLGGLKAGLQLAISCHFPRGTACWRYAIAAKQCASREGRPNAGPQTWSSSMATDLELARDDQVDGKEVVWIRDCLRRGEMWMFLGRM